MVNLTNKSFKDIVQLTRTFNCIFYLHLLRSVWGGEQNHNTTEETPKIRSFGTIFFLMLSPFCFRFFETLGPFCNFPNKPHIVFLILMS